MVSVSPALLLCLTLFCCKQMQAFVLPSATTTTTMRSSTTFLRSTVTDDVTSELLQTLKKRQSGVSLSGEETNTAIEAIDTLLNHLKKKPQQYNYNYSEEDLRTAVLKMDVDELEKMFDAGLELDEETTDTAFWRVVQAVDEAEAQDLPLVANVTKMIHHVFDADLRHLQTREKQTTNVTCMQPDDSLGVDSAARRMNYVFDDGDHKNLPITEGRRCEGGQCCDKCSRNIFPTFASEEESSFDTFPQLQSLTFNNLEKVSTATILQFVRLVERVRRTIAYEYGLPLKTILPLQAYSRKYVAGTTQQGGGGGEGDFVTLHTDEATHAGYHYSCVLYLSTKGVDFEGGDFVFNDPEEKTDDDADINNDQGEEFCDVEEVDDALLKAIMSGELPDDDDCIVFGGEEEGVDAASLEEEIRRAGRKLTPFSPTRGSAVIFSSGWENMHEVERITSGVRFVVPCFFTTCPVPDAAYEQMVVGKPKTDEDIADDWLHLLLAHRPEEPAEAVGRVKELMMKWHFICTPLSEHN